MLYQQKTDLIGVYMNFLTYVAYSLGQWSLQKLQSLKG